MNKQFKLEFEEGHAWKHKNTHIYLLNIFLPEEQCETQEEFEDETFFEYVISSEEGRSVESVGVADFRKLLEKKNYEAI